MCEIWQWFLDEYSQLYCVVRFGDDLGYKSNTMLPPNDISQHIIPVYKKIVELAHKHDKPFLLHSCGNIFSVMEEIITTAQIDAKHSNEDQIAAFSEWVNKYGDRIGNFGGIDTDLTDVNSTDVENITAKVYQLAQAKEGGLAIGSGNSIPSYVNPQKFLAMINTVRRLRGDL